MKVAEKPRKKTVGYALPPELIERAAIVAVQSGVRPCVVVERALREWLPEHETERARAS